MKKYILLLLLPVLVLAGCKQQQPTAVQKMRKAEQQARNVEKIELPDFTFYPNAVNPTFSPERSISPMLTAYMKVSKKNISAELPYLGHFYTRPLSRLDIPINFTSSNFIYTVTYDKEDENFNVEIYPQDVNDLMDGNMFIKMKMDKDGNGTVTIKTQNRDEISYKGNYK